LPHLDLNLIKRNPKLLMGYSDITSLLTYIHDQTGLVTYHGPMVAKDLAEAEAGDGFKWNLDEIVNGPQVQGGNAQGKLYGGCLSMLVASLGTPYEIRTDGTILFIEDVATKPYQLDRMLTQLRMSGKLERVHGIIFGEMPNCLSGGMNLQGVQRICKAALAGFKGPIGWGLRSGHLVNERIPGVILPIGVPAELVAEDQRMTIRQSIHD
jgi:muramoyltetrapeptide carboxypeptidase